MNYNTKLVEFDKYCTKCNFAKVTEDNDPCDKCLSEPVMENTNKPMFFEERHNNGKS